MKKNRLIIIAILVVSFFTFGLVVKADDCSSKSCFCDSTGKNCALLRNPSGNHTVSSDMTKCGCKPTGQNPVSNPSGGAGSTGTTGTSATGGTNDDIDLCQNPGVVKSAQIVGWCLFVIKIIAPILLIIFALIEIGKAVVANDDKAIQTAISSLVKRAIAAVVIFFVPTIIAFVFNVVASATEAKTKYSCLSSCINKPGSCKIPSNILFK